MISCNGELIHKV